MIALKYIKYPGPFSFFFYLSSLYFMIHNFYLISYQYFQLFVPLFFCCTNTGKTNLELAEIFASVAHSSNYCKNTIVLPLSDTINSCSLAFGQSFNIPIVNAFCYLCSGYLKTFHFIFKILGDHPTTINHTFLLHRQK